MYRDIKLCWEIFMYDNRDKTVNTLIASLIGTLVTGGISEVASNSGQKLLKNTVPINSIFKEGAEKVLKLNNIQHFNPIDKEAMELFGESTAPKFVKSILTEARKGANAAATDCGVIVNLDKAAALTFHEAQHVITHRSNLGEILTLTRLPHIQILGIGIAFASAILIPAKKDSEIEPDEKQGFIGNVLQFLKGNCVGIATLTLLPNIIDETLANIKGSQLAKTVLSKDACKIVNKLNAVSEIGYISRNLELILGVFAFKKIREFIDILKTERDNFYYRKSQNDSKYLNDTMTIMQ